MTPAHTIDPAVLQDARRMLEVAVRRLKTIEQDTHDAFKRNKARLSEALANIDAAKARLS